MIEVISDADDVLDYLEDIKTLANLQKAELGFIPYSVYKESSLKGNLFLAIVTEGQGENLFAGYVLLGGRSPTKKIFQLAVSPEYRDKGVGKLLVDAVVKDAEKDGFYEIAIKVGEKLPANRFWEKAQFALDHTIKGGQLHPVLNIRVRELMPSLFSVSKAQANLQRVASTILSGPALYSLDTNIILDISNKREGREASENLMRLVKKGDIEVAVAQESVDELEKHRQTRNDLALHLVENLSRFSLENEQELQSKLRTIIFPSKTNLSEQDISDIKNVATAIQNCAKGFITRDEAILGKQKVLWDKFSLEILSPSDFLEENELYPFDAIEMASISEKENFRIAPKLTEDSREKIMNETPEYEIDENKSNYVSLMLNDNLIANCAVEQRSPVGGRARNVAIFIWNKSATKRAVSTMLDFISRQSMPGEQPCAINLSFYGGDGQVTNVLLERGYYKADNKEYRKIFAGPVIGIHNWHEKKRAISQIGQISLPDTPPNYIRFNQNVTLKQGFYVSLQALENFLSSILILPDRGGAIMPIKRVYAEAFFAHSNQRSVFAPPEAQLSSYKGYFGTHRGKSCLSVGKLLFFYQSKSWREQGKVIAFARIVRSNIASKSKMKEESRRLGVLNKKDFIGITATDKVLETVFTHSVIFPNPVTLKRLREIGCNDPANFVTAFDINHKQVCDLLKEGGIL